MIEVQSFKHLTTPVNVHIGEACDDNGMFGCIELAISIINASAQGTLSPDDRKASTTVRNANKSAQSVSAVTGIRMILIHGFDDSDEDAYDRFEISKLRVDHPDEPEGWENVLTLNADFEAVSVETGGLSEEEKDIDLLLSDWFLALPCPFNVGDVVIDTTAPGAAPFVFDRLKFWDSKEMAAHGVNFDSRRAESLDAGIARQNECSSWDCSYMVAMGYELAAESQNPISGHGCAYYDPYGACNNYLDLEHYEGELRGERGLLAIISEHLKGRLGIEEFLYFSQAISLDAHARKQKDDFDRDYLEEVHGLYGGKTSGRHRYTEETTR